MASARTIKTLAYLMAAMTALTVVLSLVEPWTVALRAHPSARADRSTTPMPVLASMPPARWRNVQLVLAAQDSGKPADVPESHLVIQADGRIEATSLWRLGRPLPNHLLRICAVYTGYPSDALLHRWLKTCDQAAEQINLHARRIQLGATAATSRSPLHAKQLRNLQHRLSTMLADASGM